jgi:hypothetical protein
LLVLSGFATTVQVLPFQDKVNGRSAPLAVDQ